jgi:hypothetical protein
MKKIKTILKYLVLIIISIFLGISLILFPFLIGDKDGYLMIFIITSISMFLLLRKELKGDNVA